MTVKKRCRTALAMFKQMRQWYAYRSKKWWRRLNVCFEFFAAWNIMLFCNFVFILRNIFTFFFFNFKQFSINGCHSIVTRPCSCNTFLERIDESNDKQQMWFVEGETPTIAYNLLDCCVICHYWKLFTSLLWW